MKVQKILKHGLLTVFVEIPERSFAAENKIFFHTAELTKQLLEEGYEIEEMLKEPKIGYITNFRTHSDLIKQKAVWIFKIKNQVKPKKSPRARTTPKNNLTEKTVRDRISSVRKKREKNEQ